MITLLYQWKTSKAIFSLKKKGFFEISNKNIEIGKIVLSKNSIPLGEKLLRKKTFFLYFLVLET